MRHLTQLMTNAPMLMTIDAHQSNLALLNQFYQNPKLFLESGAFEGRNTFCHLSVFGPTSHRFNGLDASCNEVVSYRDLRANFSELMINDDIKQVFVEFDGPGGEATGCFDLALHIRSLASIKPVIGFINGNCFSANYALASACTQLYASSHSMGGSIGVIYGRREIQNDQEKITYFTTGEAKADGSPHTELTDAESQRQQATVDQLGEAFFSLVGEFRGLEVSALKDLQAQVFSANQLLSYGLIDGIKTEEEIKTMMKDATHKKIVAEINAAHAEERAELTNQIEALKLTHTETAQKINQLAQAAGVPELAGQLIEDQVDEQAAAKALKEAAAKKDEDISLTSGFEPQNNEAYDMQQLIEDA